MGIKHAFTSAKSDGGDATLVRPSDWNAAHAIEDFALAADISPAQITADQNDYNPAGLSTASVIRLDADAARKITGLAGGADGRILVLYNVSSGADGDIILSSQDTASTAANRFAFDVDKTLEPGSSITLIYDSTASRWRTISDRKYTGSVMRLTPFKDTDFLGPATTANRGGYVKTEDTAFTLAGCGLVLEFVFQLISLTTMTVRMGFLDTVSSADAVDGAYIEIPSSGAAVGKTANNSTRTTSATIATLSISTWYRARIVVNKGATAVDFYIFSDAGNLLGSVQNTANIPTAAGRECGHGYVATKSGTTAQAIIEMDYMSIEWVRALI